MKKTSPLRKNNSYNEETIVEILAEHRKNWEDGTKVSAKLIAAKFGVKKTFV